MEIKELNASELQDIYFALMHDAQRERKYETEYSEEHYTSERLEKLAKKIKKAEMNIYSSIKKGGEK